MKYVIYSRVSTDIQDVRTQDQECLKYIQVKENGKPFKYEIFSDPDVSSRIKMDKREGLMDMLNSLQKGDHVVVYKLDRLSRDVIEMVSIYRLIKENKCSIFSLNDSNADDEFMIGLMGVLAQKERSDISMRIKSKLKAKKDRLERVSRHLPYGFSLDKDGIHLIKNEEEFAILEKMSQLIEVGNSYRVAAKLLQQEGVLNREGHPFQHSAIHQILKRKDAYTSA